MSSRDDLDASQLPDGLSAGRHRDLQGRSHEPWVRRAVMLILVAALALGLANVFGSARPRARRPGRPRSWRWGRRRCCAAASWAQLVDRVEAGGRIAQPRIAPERGWVEGITINTIAPEAADQADDEDSLVLAYGELPAGDTLTVRIAIQVNPTTLGRKPGGVELRDAATPIARVERSVTVLP